MSNGDSSDIFESLCDQYCYDNKDIPEFSETESENIHTPDDLKELDAKRRIPGFFDFLENFL